MDVQKNIDVVRRFLLIILMFHCSFNLLKAQDYKFDIGVGAGLSCSYGDVNQWKPFYAPSSAFEAKFRYHQNLRWSWCVDFLSAGLKGNTLDFSNVIPGYEEYSYKSRLWQIGGSTEFNFLNYGMGENYRNLSRFTPFISLGIGIGGTSVDGKGFGLQIPMGVGMKYKLAPRVGVSLKLVVAKSFSDKFDGVKDPYKIESSALKNTDWYSTLSIGVSYEFGKRICDCYNLD